MEREVRTAKAVTWEKEMIGGVTMILSIPKVKTEVLSVWPNLDSSERSETVQAVRDLGLSHKALFVAGYHEREVAENEYKPEGFVKRFGLRSEDLERVYFQTHAHNAADQARWTVEMVKMMQIKSLSLYIPSWHIVRGYLTLLCALQRAGEKIPVIPVPTSTPPNRSFVMPSDSGETAGIHINQWDLVIGELHRIQSYQTRNDPPPDCVTFPELRDYLAWLWDHPIMQSERIA